MTTNPNPEARLGLHRSTDRRMIAGVAGGIAEQFDLDVTVVRMGIVVLALFGGLALPLYVAAWLLVPEAGRDRSIAEDLFGRSPLRSL